MLSTRCCLTFSSGDTLRAIRVMPKVNSQIKLSVALDWFAENPTLGEVDRTFVFDKVVSFLKVSSDVADGKPTGH